MIKLSKLIITILVKKTNKEYFNIYGYECEPCPINSIRSDSRTTGISSCECKPGFTGPDGEICTVICPANSTAEKGSSLKIACKCNDGYIGFDGGIGGSCSQCSENTYKFDINPGTCKNCPTNSISPAGSNLSTDCKCEHGYEGNNGESCNACRKGWYKNSIGPSRCQACVKGKYKPGEGAGECIDCPLDSTTSGSGSIDITDCKCNMGFTGPDGGSCTKCGSGKYKDRIGASDCSDCPANSNSLEGSTAQTDCKCNAGYSGSDGSECTACEAGFYKDSTGDGSCQPCEAGKYQPLPGQSQCKSCASLCGADQYIVGCEGVDDGTCMDNWGVMSCGWNTNGQLGLNTTVSQKNTPTLIETYYNTISSTNYNYYSIVIDKISSGYYHSLFLTWDGNVYSCGKNDSGQLGFNSENTNYGRRWDIKSNPYHIKPVLIRTFYNSSIKITEISSKGNHSLFLTSEGHVYSCGWHNRGQLGLGEDTEEKVKTPTLIQRYYDDAVEINYDRITITEISSGYYHSLFLTSQGHVYSCGWNTKGENGFEVESAQKVWVPKLIKTFEDTAYDEIQIKKISAGAFFSLFLTQTGSVYSCGSNAYGKLCLNSNDDKKTTPKLIEKSNNVRITEISSGVDHSLFLLSYGNFDIVEEEEEVEREELEEEQEEAPSVPEPESETILPPPKKKIAKKKK